MHQLALLNRVPFGKFNRASAFSVAIRLELVDESCCGVSERTTIKWNGHFRDSLQLAAGSIEHSICKMPGRI